MVIDVDGHPELLAPYLIVGKRTPTGGYRASRNEAVAAVTSVQAEWIELRPHEFVGEWEETDNSEGKRYRVLFLCHRPLTTGILASPRSSDFSSGSSGVLRG